MSPKQIPKNCKQLITLAEKAGFVFSRQKGSHMIFYHERGLRLTIPNHGTKALHPKIVKSVLRDIENASLFTHDEV
ncbi:type II toxin-antitoxin system HicA family toxin [Candidatus Nomurabacteria bacterium]|nr:type II toxin-antitoxin system HicA family toxin [Candidatus Nomurabacteria bacterium]